jgi:hypothetical protein
MTTETLKVITDLGAEIGRVRFHKIYNGWKFYPTISGRKPSTKIYQTANESIPAWARKLAAKATN